MGFRNFISKFLCCCRRRNPRVSPLPTPTVEGPAAEVTSKSSRSAGDDTKAVVTSRDPPTTTKIFNCNSTEDKHNKETDRHPVAMNNKSKFIPAKIKTGAKSNQEENRSGTFQVVEGKPELDQTAALTSQISSSEGNVEAVTPETVNIGISSQEDDPDSESTSAKCLRKWDDFDYSVPYDFYRRDPSVIDDIEPEPDQEQVDLTEIPQMMHYLLPGSIAMTDSDYTPILQTSPPTNSNPKDDHSVHPTESAVVSNSDDDDIMIETPQSPSECPVMGDTENKSTQVVQISAPPDMIRRSGQQIDISHTHEPPVPVSECSVLGVTNYLPVVKNSALPNLYSQDIIPRLVLPIKPVEIPYTGEPSVLPSQCPDISERVTDEFPTVKCSVPRNLYLRDSIYRQNPVQPVRQSPISFNHGETGVECPVRPESPKTPIPIRKNRDIIYDKFGVPETTSSNAQIPKKLRSIYFNPSVEFASFRELSDERTKGFQRTYDMLKLEGPLHKIMSRREKVKQLDELSAKRIEKVIDPVVKIVQEPGPGGVGQGPPSKTRSRREKVEPLDELLVKRLEKIIGPVKKEQEPEPGGVGLVEEPETPKDFSPPPELEVKNLPKKSDRGLQFSSIIEDLKRSIKEAQKKSDRDDPEQLDELMAPDEDLEEAKDKDDRSMEDRGH